MPAEGVSRSEAVLAAVMRAYGEQGVQAVALFMQGMGADAMLSWSNERLVTVWTPCDAVMQLAWSMTARHG